MTTIMPLNEVKTRFSALADEVAATHDRVTVTRNGKPHVVILAVEDYEAMRMTLDLMATSGALAEAQAAARDIESGDYLDEAELQELLSRRRENESPE